METKAVYTEQKQSLLKKMTSRTEFSTVVALIVLVIVMSILSPVFMTATNIFNVLGQVSRYAIISVGMALVMISGGIDLAVGYLACLCACVCCALSSSEMFGPAWPWYLALLVTLALGAFIGLLNGLIITKIRIVPFIVTLAMGKILTGAALLLTQGKPIYFDNALATIAGGYVGPVPVCVIVMFLCVIIGTIFTNYTLTGRNIYAIGNNERAANLSGIKVDKLKTLTYVITGFLCAVCGVIVAGSLQMSDSAIGKNYETDCIAAVVIGGVAMTGGEGTVWGSLVGAAIMGILKNAFTLLGVSAYWQSIVIGIVIIGAVALDSVRSANAEKAHKAKADAIAKETAKRAEAARNAEDK